MLDSINPRNSLFYHINLKFRICICNTCVLILETHSLQSHLREKVQVLSPSSVTALPQRVVPAEMLHMEPLSSPLTSLFFSQTIQTVTENGTIMHTTQQWLTTYNLFLNISSENIQTIDNIWNQNHNVRVEVLTTMLLKVQVFWEHHELHNQWQSNTS
jgi:hypothetical protein